MIACLIIPGFALRAALRARPRLQLVPAALAPEPGKEAVIGPVTAAAEAAGVQAGMRMGEALATCPGLVLSSRIPAAVEQEWEGVLRRLEDSGFAVESAEPGVVTFETAGSRAALRRCGGGARTGARLRRNCLGPACGRGCAPLRRPRGGERRPSRAGGDRRGEGGAGLPGAAPALAPAAPVGPVRRARRARGAPARRAGVACRAAPSRSGWGRRGSGRGASQAGSGARLDPVCVGDRPRQSWRRPSPSPRRSRTS